MSMMWVGIGSAALSAGTTLYTNNKNAKALKGAQAQPLDIAKVIAEARENAAANLQSSIALENTLRPGTAALRTTNDLSLGNMASGNTAGIQARDSLLAGLTEGTFSGNPLLEASTSSILDSLKLGGTLGKDVQAQAVKAALEKGGAAGISGSGAARGLVARDLGLTSMQVLQQRQAQGLQAGVAAESAILGRYGAAAGAAGQDIQRAGLLASIIEGRALPESGLSPGSIANLYVGDKNTQDQVRMDAASASAAQRSSNMNALLGFGTTAMSAYGTSKKAGSPGVADPSNPYG